MSTDSDTRPGRPNVTIEKKFLITLWYLSNTECFRSVADRFGVSIKLCWNAVTVVCDMLLRLNRVKKIIVWPDHQTATVTADYCKTKANFPGVIGFIDATHIPIPAPKIHPDSYINRKKFHSVLLQAVCNEKMVFTDCYTGEAGSIHDSCLFRRSNFFRRISNGSLTISPDCHLLGDQGYGLKTYIMVPFKDTGHLSNVQKKFNQTLSTLRVTIERAFGLLKNRFRRLQGLSTRKPENIPLIIMASCILHNICLEENDYLDDNELVFGEEISDEYTSLQERETVAEAKRITIMNEL